MLKFKEVDLKEYTDFVDTQPEMSFFTGIDDLAEFEAICINDLETPKERLEELTQAEKGEAFTILLLDGTYSVFIGNLQ